MDWLLNPIKDFFVGIFENVLQPLGHMPNLIFFSIIAAGFLYWMYVQHKLNKQAENDPNQIK